MFAVVLDPFYALKYLSLGTQKMALDIFGQKQKLLLSHSTLCEIIGYICMLLFTSGC